MDDESTNHDKLESIVQDPSAQPCDLRLQDLKYITNNFATERELGRGGFGVVYKGVLPNGAKVAVKNLLSMSHLQEQRFQNEVDNLMKVRHQNIVRFLGYSYETQQKYVEHEGKHVFAEMPKRLLCFEYMPKGSLAEHISDESCGLDWHQRYKIIKGVCCGLHYLHEECQTHGSVIHLDLKPANILLDDNMVPKIADFGLSKFFDDKKVETCATSLLGSRGYMAPEYIGNRIISKMADIYSLGVIIIQVIMGSIIDLTSSADFVEPVLANWRQRPIAAPSENDCKQIKGCLEIGLNCVETDREKRPTIGDIIKILSVWENTNGCVNNVHSTPGNEAIHKPKELLEINPLELQFSLEQNYAEAPAVVRLTNQTDDSVAFYFMVTKAKNKYHIEPDRGLLLPRSTSNVLVTMTRQETPRLFKCTDEFLVQSIWMWGYRAISKPIRADMFDNMRSNMVHRVKLTAVYMPPVRELAKSSPESKLSNPGGDREFPGYDETELMIKPLSLDNDDSSLSVRRGNSASTEISVRSLSSVLLHEQKCGAAEIRSLAKNADNRTMLVASGAIPALVKLLSSEDLETQEHAVTALANLSLDNEQNKNLIMAVGALVPIIQMLLRMGSKEARENAAAVIFNLSTIDDNQLVIGSTPGAFEALIESLERGGSWEMQSMIARALFNLCRHTPNKVRAIRAGIAAPLMRMLQDRNASEYMSFSAVSSDKQLTSLWQDYCTNRSSSFLPRWEDKGFLKKWEFLLRKRKSDSLAILALLVSHNDSRVAIPKAHAIPLLVDLLKSGQLNNYDREHAASILLELCKELMDQSTSSV